MSKHAPITQDKLDTAAALLEDGASQREVCRSTGISRMTLWKYFPGKGWTYKEGGDFLGVHQERRGQDPEGRLMGYVYRGTVRDIEPEPRETRPFDDSKCGTYAGYRQHGNRGTEPCQPCREAATVYQRVRRGAPAGPFVPRMKGFNPAKCGTYAGYCQHNRKDVPVCEACLAAYREYYRAWAARKKVAA